MTSKLDHDLGFVVVCTKNDLWQAKICIASIRYFHPAAIIYVVKDELRGGFSIEELRRYFAVEEIRYKTNKFGISAAKIFFYTDMVRDERLYLVLDADIVLLGPATCGSVDFDVAVSAEYDANPSSPRNEELYFRVSDLASLGYHYPGFFFNAGQLYCRRGFLSPWRQEIEKYFDFNSCPRWRRLDIMPKHDQSLVNFLLPMLERAGALTISKLDFMIWTGWPAAEKWSLKDVREGRGCGLLHYAGVPRNRVLARMPRPDLLHFFNEYYYSQLPAGSLRRIGSDFSATLSYYLKTAGRRVKQCVGKRQPA